MFSDYDCFSFNEECNLIDCIVMFSNCNSALLLTYQNMTEHRRCTLTKQHLTAVFCNINISLRSANQRVRYRDNLFSSSGPNYDREN